MFWNSAWTVPIEMLIDPAITPEEAENFVQTLDQAGEDPDNYPPGYADVGSLEQAQARLTSELLWGEWQLLYDTVPGDDGEPLVPKDATNSVGIALRGISDQATEELIVASAYLILTDSTIEHLKSVVDRGVEVSALTNSLAANNHTTAFVGYRKQRKNMIRNFTRLYEYRPDAQAQTEVYKELAPGEEVPHLGLHAKNSVYDRKAVFIGSFNLDPRSENLNTEIGILVKSEELANMVADSILEDMGPGSSFQLRLDDRGRTEWFTVEEDGSVTVEANDEPLSSSGRMIEADLAQPLTPKSQM